MNEPKRKKSASSDSELSDGWSLVEHLDTVPLAPRSADMTPQLHSSVPQHPAQEIQTLAIRHLPVSPSDETSSDAESVEIIQEDARLCDFVFPRGITRITPLTKGEVEKESEREKDPAEVKEVMLNESGSEYLIGTSIYSNEWFRLLIFISSLVALLLLLVSYTSLFFKEQAYSKSDGLIVLPDEDLSSLIADLALLKEENNRLKGELNMIKYEYGNDKKLNVKHEEPMEISATEDIIGLEVISDESPLSVEPIHFKPLTIGSDKAGDQVKESINLQQKRVEDLAKFEDNLKTFANNLGLNNIVVSSYNIANNLDSINSIVKNLKTVIDKESSSKKENKKFQLEQKLMKLHNKIEQDFKKSVEKVAKRVSKFHDEFLSAYCRIKVGVSDTDNIDCSKFDHVKKDNHQKSKEHKDGFKKQSKNFVKSGNFNGENRESKNYVKSGNFNNENRDPNQVNMVPDAEDSSNPDKIDQANENDFITRFKRFTDINKVLSAFNNQREKTNQNDNSNYEHKHVKQDKYPENRAKTYKESHHSKQQHFETEKNVNEDNFDENRYFDKSKHLHDPNFKGKEDKKKEKHHKNKDYKSEMKTEDWKKEKKNKYNKYEEEKLKSEANFLKYNDESKEDINSSEEMNSKYLKKEKEEKFDEYKCPKKNCDKKLDRKIDKNSQKFIKSEQEFGKFGNNGKNPSGPSTIHNESVYSKIVNGSGKRKIEPNGEWYLDLGEVRNQKRLRRAVRDRSGWMFDRALVRDWCRTNSGSSLCTSFGQFCDYCV